MIKTGCGLVYHGLFSQILPYKDKREYPLSFQVKMYLILTLQYRLFDKRCGFPGSIILIMLFDMFTALDCPNPHQTFEACRSSCPNTCLDMQAETSCTAPCEPGCVCEPGYYWQCTDNTCDNMQCVEKKSCGCEDTQGNWYPVSKYTQGTCKGWVNIHQKQMVHAMRTCVNIHSSADTGEYIHSTIGTL